MENLLTEDMYEKFNKLHWHDSKLISFEVNQSEDGSSHDIILYINFISKNSFNEFVWLPNKIILFDCTIAKFDLDLDGKIVCSDSIADAFCTKESDLKDKIEKGQLQYEKSPLADYYHFKIQLIHPGGEINVFAKRYEIENN